MLTGRRTGSLGVGAKDERMRLGHPHLGASATRNSVFSAGGRMPGDPGYSGSFP